MKITQIRTIVFDRAGRFYVIALGDDNQLYYWNDKKWNILENDI